MDMKHNQYCHRQGLTGTELPPGGKGLNIRVRKHLENAGKFQVGSNRDDKGFSTVELAISLALFLLISTVVALAVARTLGAATASRAIRAAEAAAGDELNKFTTISYADLVSGSFTVPDPCSGTADGIAGESCVTNGNLTMTITYQYQDTVNGAVACATTSNGTRLASTYGFVGLCAKVTKISGTDNTLTTSVVQQRVNAPSPKYAPDGGVVRVTLAGDYADVPGKLLYLVKASSPTTVVSSTVYDESGVGYFAVADPLKDPATSCSAQSPCMLALTPSTSSAVNGNLALYGDAARPGAGIVVATGKVTDSGAYVTKVPTLRLDLLGTNNTQVSPPTRTGSVCLWLSFFDGGKQNVPVCNSGNARYITVDSYDPSWAGGSSGATYPLPANQVVTVTTDDLDGTCPSVPGMVAWDGNGTLGTAGWKSAKVCTSWTWGNPQELPSNVTLSSGQTAAKTITWKASDTANAAPAAGYSNLTADLWVRPRAIEGCSIDGSCAPVQPNNAPEDTLCPEQFCLSGLDLPAEIVAPANKVVISNPSTTTSFTLTAADPDSNGIYIYSTSGVTGGTLSDSNGSIGAGTLLASSTGKRASTTLSYTRTASSSTFTIPLKLCPAATATPSACAGSATLVFATTPVAGTMTLDDVAAAQGATGHSTITVRDSNGALYSGQTITLTGPSGVSFTQATVTTDSNGAATIDVLPGNIAAGTYTITATTTGAAVITADATLTVLPTPTALSLTTTSMKQGSRGSADVSVTDAAGNAAKGVNVIFSVTQNGLSSAAVYPAVGGCQTSQYGSCSVQIVAEPGAETGTYTVTAASGGLSHASSITVSQKMASITLDPTPTMAQGASQVSFLAKVLDGAGNPLVSQVIAVSGDGQVTADTTHVTTGTNGLATVRLSVSNSASAGSHNLTFTWGTDTVVVKVNVVAGAANVTSNGTTVAQGGTASLSVTVTDAAGAAVTGKEAFFSTSYAGLTVDSRAYTDSSGVATVNVRAGLASAGGASINVTVDGVSTSVAIVVTATPANGLLSGTIPQGGSATVVVKVLDQVGDPIANLPVSLDAGVASLLATPPSRTTNSTGQASFTVQDSGPTPAGQYTATITVVTTHETLTAPLVVQAAPASITFNPGSGSILTQGDGYDVTATLRDQHGDPVGLYPVALVGGPGAFGSGVTATADVTTDLSGQFTFNLSADKDATVGIRTASFASGNISQAYSVYLTTLESESLVNQGASAVWPLDEQSGTSARDITGLHNGTVNGAVGTSGAYFHSTGYTLNTNTGISIPDTSSDLLPGTSSFTITAWVKPDSGAQSPFALGKGTRLVVGDSGDTADLPVTLFDGTTTVSKLIALSPGQQPSDWVGKWTNLSLVVDRNAKTISVFVNGVQAGQSSYSESLGDISSVDPLTFGGVSGWNMNASSLDDVAIFPSALTQGQVKDVYSLGSPYTTAVLSDNPLGYWKLDENTGATTAVDYSGNQLAGTYLAGGTNIGGEGALGTGVTNGTLGSVSLLHVAGLNLGSTWTLEAWVKPTTPAVSLSGVLGGQVDSADNLTRGPSLYLLSPDSTGQLVASWSSGATNYTQASTATSNIVGQWTHLVATADGSHVTLYINGTAQGTFSETTTQGASALEYLGYVDSAFKGQLDEVSVYKSSLSASRVLAHFQAVTP